MNDPRANPSIFARGAVDLSALRAPSTSAAQRGGSDVDAGQDTDAASPASPSPGPGAQPAAGGGVVVVDVTEATFQSEVLERSLSPPVVVDFWAGWCGPCKQLSPVLERLAVEGGGAWVLAKVDVDANPRLAQMFRVQGIPMVYAVVGGQPIDAFSGVVPEPQLRQWIDSLLQTAGAAAEAPEDPRLNAADEAMMSGDLDSAEEAYRKILSESPADAVAGSGLAQVSLMRRVRLSSYPSRVPSASIEFTTNSPAPSDSPSRAHCSASIPIGFRPPLMTIS